MRALILSTFITISYSLSAQVCNADFTHVVDSNNVVTVTTSSTYPCANPPWNGVYQTYDFGNPYASRLNSFYPFSGIERKHFYKYPGTYNICTYMYAWATCSCEDSTCHQITIADTGSVCEAKYCYNSDTVREVTYLINLSTADDPVVNVYWDFQDGSQSTAYHVGHAFVIPVPVQETYLFIQTQKGCQDEVVDTIIRGMNTCPSIPITVPQHTFDLLEGCWRWDYYRGGLAGLPQTPAWSDIRAHISRDAIDSFNGTVSFITYADTMAVDSGRANIWVDSLNVSWFAMDDIFVRAFPGFPMPPFPPIYFQEYNGTLEFTHFDISDDFHYGFVNDSCGAPVPQAPDKVIDSIISLFAGCWRYDFYEGGLAGFPPTPSGVDVKFQFSQDLQDSLNQTMSFVKFVNAMVTDSGRVRVTADTGSFHGSQFIPDIIAGSDSIAYWFNKDTLLFTHSFFADDFTYGYVRDVCPDPVSFENIDSVIALLKGCWQWDHYYGGRTGLPPTPATSNIRIELSQSALDSLNHTLTGKSFLNDTLQFSGNCDVVFNTGFNFYTLSCGLFDSLGIVGSAPLYFYFESDTLVFPQEQFLDGFVYVFTGDTCAMDSVPPDTTTTVIDSVINVLNGCWQWDHYFGGFIGIPPTPAWMDVNIEFSQDAQDTLNRTVTGKSFLNDTLEYSGTCSITADTNAIGYYYLSCPLFDSIGIVGWPPLYFNFEGDTLLFPQESFVDGYVYGFLKNCEEDTVINAANFPDEILLKIYPNPASDKMIIEVSGVTQAKISLYNVVGKQLIEQEAASGKMIVDVSQIANGIYFIRMETEKGMLLRKVVVGW